MGEVKQINIKNRTYYFYNDMINLKNFEPNLLKIDRKSYKNIGIYNIGYITIKKKMIVKIFTAYIFCICWLIMEADISKKKLENKELLKKYNNVWNGIKNKIKAVSSGDCDYEKDYMKIKFNLMITYH